MKKVPSAAKGIGIGGIKYTLRGKRLTHKKFNKKDAYPRGLRVG